HGRILSERVVKNSDLSLALTGLRRCTGRNERIASHDKCECDGTGIDEGTEFHGFLPAPNCNSRLCVSSPAYLANLTARPGQACPPLRRIVDSTVHAATVTDL